MAMLFVALCAFFNQRNVWSQLAYASSVEILGGQRSALSPWVLIISFLLGFPAACGAGGAAVSIQPLDDRVHTHSSGSGAKPAPRGRRPSVGSRRPPLGGRPTAWTRPAPRGEGPTVGAQQPSQARRPTVWTEPVLSGGRPTAQRVPQKTWQGRPMAPTWRPPSGLLRHQARGLAASATRCTPALVATAVRTKAACFLLLASPARSPHEDNGATRSSQASPHTKQSSPRSLPHPPAGIHPEGVRRRGRPSGAAPYPLPSP